MKSSKELRQELGELVHQSRTILDRAETEKRAKTADENGELARLDERMDALEKEIPLAEKQERRETIVSQPTTVGIRPNVQAADDGEEVNQKVIDRYRERYGAMGVHIARRMGMPESKTVSSRRYRASFDRWLVAPRGTGISTLTPEEQRDLSVGVAAQGGYTVPQEEFVAELIKTMDNEAVVRGLGRKFQIPQAQSLGAPSLAADPADPDWTTELAIGGKDSTMAFGRRELHPWPIAKYLYISDKLLRASPLGMEGIVRERLAYKLAVAHSKAFNTGTGINQPLGLFTADANGISTARNVDVSTTNVIDPDKLVTARYTLRQGYAPNARWLMHRLFLAKIRTLKLSNQGYLWQPGLTVGAPNTLLDFPYSLDEYAPSTLTGTGVNIAILGNFDYYWIADALDVRVQRLDELGAATNQVIFIIRAETDAAPVLEDAFVRCIGTLT